MSASGTSRRKAVDDHRARGSAHADYTSATPQKKNKLMLVLI